MGKLGGHLLVECLTELGGTIGFGVPGESYLKVLDGIYGQGDAFLFISCRQEGGAAYMASAYGKLTGQPGLCFVTRGPGATNASVGLHTAMQDSSPMICFVGQIGLDMREREAFQELDYRAVFGPMVKWATEIEDAKRIPEIMSRAWATALSGRPGPVVIALPENVLSDQVDVPVCKPVRIPMAAASATQIAEAKGMLSAAKRPILLVGGCGWGLDEAERDHALKALKEFATAADLPVLAAARYHDLFDHEDPHYTGDVSVGTLPHVEKQMREADLIIAVGVRWGEFTSGGYEFLSVPNPKQKLIHVHASDRELNKVYAADLPIHAHPASFVDAMRDIRVQVQWAGWRAENRSAHKASFDLPDQPDGVDMRRVMAHLKAVLPDDAILTHGAGNFAIWFNKVFAFGKHQRLLGPQSGSMGYGLPAAIAAKAVHPKCRVVCIAGDGDFQMNMQELGTAMQHGLQPIVLILNNGTYGTIRMHQEREFPDRVSGTDIANPDFVAIAKAYGFHSERVAETEAFEVAFERCLNSDTGGVLEIMISAEAITPRKRLSAIKGAA